VTAFDQQTILIVDDEAFSRTMVAQMLKRLGAREVHQAEDGYQAIEVLNRLPITVLITDFRMPGIHGLQLLKRVRTGQTAAPRNLTCAMLTGYAVRHLVGLAIVLDVDAFLAKPVSAATLTKHLMRAFQYRFEPLPIDNYEAIDVTRADAFLAETASPAAKPSPAPEPEAAVEEIEPPAERRPAAPAGPGPTAPAKTPSTPERASPTERRPAAAAAPAADPGAVKRVALNEVPEGAVLARDIVGSSGTLLLASGTAFRGRYVKRLQELRDLEGDITHVWVRG
jgi:two-component system chemotaxis response regulator CheY